MSNARRALQESRDRGYLAMILTEAHISTHGVKKPCDIFIRDDEDVLAASTQLVKEREGMYSLV